MSARLRAATDELATRDSTMRSLIERFGPPHWGSKPPVRRRFEHLARSICYQQLAGKAAATIWGRTVTRIGGQVTPRAILDQSASDLRTAGLSQNKALSLRDLAAHVDDGRIDLSVIGRKKDDDVIEQLTQVRGIGEWTAQMFLIFALHRLDVWAAGDLAVRRGYAQAYHCQPIPTAKQFQPLGAPFRPYRSLACHYFWKTVDDDDDAWTDSK